MEPTFSYIYSIPYILVYIFYFILFLWENNLKKNNKDIRHIRWACMLVFLGFFGLRGYLDTDFAVYYPLYEDAPTIFDFNKIAKFFSDFNDTNLTRIEPGFKVYLILFKTITSNYYFLQFGSTLLDIFFLNYFFKKYSPQYALSFILFMIFSGIIIEINLLRNIKSIFIFLYSLQYIRKRKILQYYLCMLVAYYFHSSSIFYFPLYFFLHRKLPNIIIWFVFIVGNMVYLMQLKFIAPIVLFITSYLGGAYSLLAEYYTNSDLYSSGYGITIGFVERFFTYIILFLSYNKIRDLIQDKATINIFYNSFFIYFICYTFLSEYSIFIDRVTILFVFSYWILFAYLFVTLNNNLRSKFSFLFFFFGMFKMYKANNFITHDYKNILFESKSYKDAYREAFYIMNKNLDKILNPKK